MKPRTKRSEQAQVTKERSPGGDESAHSAPLLVTTDGPFAREAVPPSPITTVQYTAVNPSSAKRSRRFAAITLFLCDQGLIFVGFVIAYWMRYIADLPAALEIQSEILAANRVPFAAFLPITLLLMGVLAVFFTARGLYRTTRNPTLFDQFGIIFSSVLTGIALLIVVVFLYRPFYYSRLIFPLAGVTIVTLLSLARLLLVAVRHWRWSRGKGLERVLVVGGTGLGQQVLNSLAAQPGLGYDLVGYLDAHPIVNSSMPSRVYRHLGPINTLPTVIAEQQVQRVILALPYWEQARLPDLVELCRTLGVDYQIAPDLYQISFDRVDLMQVSGVPLIRPKEVSLAGLNLLVKRIFDVSLIVASAPLTLPISLLVALAVRLDSPGPALFRQTRVGKDGQLFTCYKFRTMVVDAEQRKAELSEMNEADGPLFKMRDDPRITRLGRFLRRTSLDEWPQLINVLRGEMSLIGPRPALPEEVERYEPWQRRRIAVVPGCAGLSQALGRSDISFDEGVRLDIYYAENWSFGMDLRILLMLIPAVMSGRGAY
jgi:exopolysaccharide biosynthesis polyprenyl glycosylphosphotransferase